MIDALIFVSQRPVVISLAVVGALFVIGGSLFAKPQRPGHVGDPSENDLQPENSTAKLLTTIGYAITALSIVLFIVAGFVSDLRP